jgi:hypothetical protein
VLQAYSGKAYSVNAETVFSYHDSGPARTPIDSLLLQAEGSNADKQRRNILTEMQSVIERDRFFSYCLSLSFFITDSENGDAISFHKKGKK